LFRSEQFVWNFAFAEEFLGTEVWPGHPQVFVPQKGKRYMNILRTLKIVTCLYEFAARMASQQLLSPSASLSIELHEVDGRELSYMSPKPSLDGKYWGRTDKIQIERVIGAEELQTKAGELALDVTLEIFSKFGWQNPPRSLFAEEQARILNR
jgi:hypothetical protein